MAVRLTPPKHNLVRRSPLPVKGTRASKYPWDAIRQEYIEGVQNNPTKDPFDIHWPTQQELSAKYNVPEPTMAARAARERWTAQKKSMMVSVDAKRRAAKIRAMQKEGVEFDNTVLNIAKVGNAVVMRRLAEVLKAAGERERMGELNLAAMERGELVDLTLTKKMADFDAREIVDLATAASTYTSLGRSVIGDPDAMDTASNDQLEEVSISDRMRTGGTDKLVELLEALGGTGALKHVLGQKTQVQLTAEEDGLVIDAELVEADQVPVQSRFALGSDLAVREAPPGAIRQDGDYATDKHWL